MKTPYRTNANIAQNALATKLVLYYLIKNLFYLKNQILFKINLLF